MVVVFVIVGKGEGGSSVWAVMKNPSGGGRGRGGGGGGGGRRAIGGRRGVGKV